MNPGTNRDWVIVFDLDDTLYPEADFVRSGFQAVDRAWSRAAFKGSNRWQTGYFRKACGAIFSMLR